MAKRRDNIILAALTILTCVIAVGAVFLNLSNWDEAIGFVTGVIAVYLTAKENVWNWPVGLVNSAFTYYVLWKYHLLSDAWLQIVFFVLGAFGWYWWLHGGQDRKEIHIARTPRIEWIPIAIVSVIATVVLAMINAAKTDAAPFLDSFTTIGSLVAQYMLTRKYIENWIFWILVDVLYVPLLLWKGLYLFALLYVIFTVLAFLGLRYWKDLRNEQQGLYEPLPARSPVGAMLGIGVLLSIVMLVLCIRMESAVGSDALKRVRLSEKTLFSRPGGSPKDIDPELGALLKLNGSDPLTIKERKGEPGVLLGQVTFRAEGAKDVVYEVYSEAIRIDGKDFDRSMWNPYIERLLNL